MHNAVWVILAVLAALLLWPFVAKLAGSKA